MGATTVIAGIGAAAAVAGTVSSMASSKKAGSTQAGAANQASDATWSMYQQNRLDSSPWMNAGTDAIGKYSQAMQPGGEAYNMMDANNVMSGWQSDPGYAWSKQEGINALAASGAAAGNYGSGNMGTALTQYGTNVANQEYGDIYKRRYGATNDYMNKLSAISGVGQTSAQYLGSQGAAAANNMGNYMTQAGQAQAGGILGSANAWNQGISGVGNAGGSAYSQYLNQQYQNKLMGYGGGSGGSGGMYGSYDPAAYSGVGGGGVSNWYDNPTQVTEW
jgi:hypothetical protein